MQPVASQPNQANDPFLQARLWPDILFHGLGPGDLDRKESALRLYCWGPMWVFVAEMMLWLVLMHYSPQACIMLTVLIFVGCATMLVLFSLGKRWGPVSLLTLGILCLLAAGAGLGCGLGGWERYWRQWVWTQTGVRISNLTAAVDPQAVSDAAVLSFWDQKRKHTHQFTSVDASRSAGHVDDELYCVAPVLNPQLAGQAVPPVSFWAAGVGCCHSVGAFTCDDSRDLDGGYGMVLVGNGHEDKLRLAVQKAEAVHGLKSLPGAIFVQWVKDPTPIIYGVFGRGCVHVVVSTFVAALVFFWLGGAAWYFGVGKRGSGARTVNNARVVLVSTNLNTRLMPQ